MNECVEWEFNFYVVFFTISMTLYSYSALFSFQTQRIRPCWAFVVIVNRISFLFSTSFSKRNNIYSYFLYIFPVQFNSIYIASIYSCSFFYCVLYILSMCILYYNSALLWWCSSGWTTVKRDHRRTNKMSIHIKKKKMKNKKEKFID